MYQTTNSANSTTSTGSNFTTTAYSHPVDYELENKVSFLLKILQGTNYFVQGQSEEANITQQELNTNIFKNLNKLVIEVFPEPSIEKELQKEIDEDPIRNEFVEVPKTYDEKTKEARQQFIDFLTEIKAVAEANQELEENSYGYPKVFGWYHKEY